ncbi:MAG: hypothetical protein RIR15_693, partial [Actinomycetota bacterium]
CHTVERVEVIGGKSVIDQALCLRPRRVDAMELAG